MSSRIEADNRTVSNYFISKSIDSQSACLNYGCVNASWLGWVGDALALSWSQCELCGGVRAVMCQLHPALFLLLSPIPGSEEWPCHSVVLGCGWPVWSEDFFCGTLMFMLKSIWQNRILSKLDKLSAVWGLCNRNVLHFSCNRTHLILGLCCLT